jgi:signal transduction histidine kinase
VHGSVTPHIVTARSQPIGILRVLVQSMPGRAGVTIVVAQSAAPVTALHRSLIRVLVAVIVAGTLLLGVLLWLVVSRSLRTVEAMRRTALDLSVHALDRRLATNGSGDEFDRLATTLNDLLDRLQQAIDRERRFVADASHELRTPIAGVRALLETDPVNRDALERSRSEALGRLGDLERLVEELLVLARTDAPKSVRRLVDLDDLVLGVARQLAGDGRVVVETSAVSAGQVVGCDAELHRLVENLATNAVRHARSTVRFALRQEDDIVELNVSDDGPGIPAAERDRVFERFAMLDDARASDGKRFGLGLAIAATIVAGHGGTIRIGEAPHGGARLVVCLPASGASSAERIET